MLMPKGLGHALKNWQIERARKNQGSVYSLQNTGLLILLIICLLKFSLFGFILWGILIFGFYLLSHIKIGHSDTISSLPELPYVGDQFRGFSSSQKLSIFVAAAFQIVLVSILDARISGVGTAYYLVDFIFIILSIFGLILLYSSLASYISDYSKIFDPTTGLSSEQKKQLMVLGLAGIVFVYLVDYLVAGSGTIYLFIDVIFLLLEVSGIALAVITLFLSRSELMSLFNDLGTKLKALTEVQKWALMLGGVAFTAFVYFLDTVTSGSGIIYYVIDLLYLVCLLLGILAVAATIAKSKAEISHRLNLLFVAVAVLLLYFADMIEPGLVRDTESKMYVKELAYLFLVLSFNDLTRLIFSVFSSLTELINQNESFRNIKEQASTNLRPFPLIFGIILFLYVPFEQIEMLGLFFILYSINPLTKFVSKIAENLQRNFWGVILPASKAQYGRSSERGSWVTFAFFLVLLMYLAWWLPSVTNFTKSMQILNVEVKISKIFCCAELQKDETLT